MGSKKKSTGGTTADKRAATTGIQHKYDQTTAFWREIQVVHNRPTQAKGAASRGKRGDGGGQETTRMEEHEYTSWEHIESTQCR